MCNLSQGIEDRGIAKGIERAIVCCVEVPLTTIFI